MRKWIVVLALYALVALAAAFGLVGADHAVQHDGREWLPPLADGALLGTDYLGRDVLARTLHGTRLALLVGVFGAGVAVTIGTVFGLLAGWRRGALDATLNWIAGAVAAVPGILLILTLAALLGRGLGSVVLAVGLVSWVGVFRLVRAEAMRLRDREFVTAARLGGAGTLRVLALHVLPNLAPLVLVQASLRFVDAVQAEIVVTFLGVGMVTEPSWGRAIARAPFDLPQGAWWPLAAAAVALVGLMLCVQRLADHLRDRLPRAASS